MLDLLKMLVRLPAAFLEGVIAIYKGEAGYRAPIAFTLLLILQFVAGSVLGLGPLGSLGFALGIAFIDFYTAFMVGTLLTIERGLSVKQFLLWSSGVTSLGCILAAGLVILPSAWFIGAAVPLALKVFFHSTVISCLLIFGGMTWTVLEELLDREKAR